MHSPFNTRIERRTFSGLLVTVALSIGLSGCGVPQAEYDKLAKRVEELEKQAKAPRVERLVIVDKDGKERGMLGMREKDHTPALRFRDEKGTNRLLARLHPTGMPIFVMWGKGGKGTSYLSVPGEGPPSMMFFNAKGDQVHKAPVPMPPTSRRRHR
ncbi:MAG: hypothetical protein KC502_19510 [Myxococcales bacterium]|nr:hypothetical protein [Myxococcales bacterium]